MITKGEFKGKPVITITDDIRKHKRISFGITKAKLVLSAIKEIEEFVRENDTQANTQENKPQE